jgi:aldose 1-epimerase
MDFQSMPGRIKRAIRFPRSNIQSERSVSCAISPLFGRRGMMPITMKPTPLLIIVLLVVAPMVRGAVSEAEFGQMPDGTAVKSLTITNASGSSLQLITYGAAIVSLKVPDREGAVGDVVLGFDNLNGYLRRNPFFGAIVGRYGNRIAGAKFTLDGTEYRITANDRQNTLHGGRRGFDKVVWKAAKIDEQTVECSYLSKDGEEGFPGNLNVRVRYSFNDANEMKIEYTAATDKPTVVNLTNHAYYNLAGAGSGDILNHELMIHADRYTPGDAGLIPTGELAPVEGTPFDFRQPHKIGLHIDDDNAQLRAGGGYDHNFVLSRSGEGLQTAATVYEPKTGRLLTIQTTAPGLQFYSGNGLANLPGKNGATYVRRGGFCLEPQHFPDSPNHPAFPSTTLKPGETFHSTSVYQFTTRKSP